MRSKTRFSVIGGAYREICLQPNWNSVFGSGARAAAAVSGLANNEGVDVELVTWSDADTLAHLKLVCAAYCFHLTAFSRKDRIEFQYDFPIGIPRSYPPVDQLSQCPVESIDGECCLVFGTLEAEPFVHCNTLVYDPQSGLRSKPLSKRGFTAVRTAIVANRGEAIAMAQQLLNAPNSNDPLVVGEFLRQSEQADVVIIKNGCEGAAVIDENSSQWVPCFRTSSVFSIGSGDVFSAIFAWFWGQKHLSAVQSAELASAATAEYCGNCVLPVSNDIATRMAALSPLKFRSIDSMPLVYLAGPLFTLSELWLLAECKRCLEELGVAVFSPKDDVGILGNAKDVTVVAQEDIAGLRRSQLVLALIDGLDTGTIFEIGYARAIGIPVILVGERVSDADLTMLVGTGCELCRDLTSAIYRAVWMLRSE